jgi:hypothetical protein
VGGDPVKVGDIVYEVNDMEEPVLVKRVVKTAGPRRVTTEGPGGSRTHTIVGPTQWSPALHTDPAACIANYIAGRQNEIERSERRRALAQRQLLAAQKSLAKEKP